MFLITNILIVILDYRMLGAMVTAFFGKNRTKFLNLINFSALCFCLFGCDETVNSDELRDRMFGQLLHGIINGEFVMEMPTTRMPIRQHLERALLETPPFEANVPYYLRTLEEYARHMSRPARGCHEKWAQVNDAILASIILERPVVIIHPRVLRGDQRQNRLHEGQAHRIEVFFPDGDTMVGIL